MSGELLRRTERRDAPEEVPVEVPATETSSAVADTDDLLDEIDEVLDETLGKKEKMDALMAEIDLLLEPDAQAFVESYQQRGGQ